MTLLLISCSKEQTKWEYTTGSISDNLLNDELNKLGSQGWELVFARRAIDTDNNKGIYEFIFKRIKIEEQQKTEWQKREEAIQKKQELAKLGLYD